MQKSLLVVLILIACSSISYAQMFTWRASTMRQQIQCVDGQCYVVTQACDPIIEVCEPTIDVVPDVFVDIVSDADACQPAYTRQVLNAPRVFNRPLFRFRFWQ